MKTRAVIPLFLATLGCAFAQAPTGPYVPGVTYATTNPNYPNPNPLYFEGKITWELLKIDQPSTFWEYLQRGIHYQDDLENVPLAIADYQKALAGNSLQNGTCQLVTAATLTVAAASGAGSPNSLPATLNPPACMFTIRLRLGYLLRDTDPQTAIRLFNEVLQIDPLRLDVNALIGDTYVSMASAATAAADQQAALKNAAAAYKAELALSPVTAQYTALTGDTANNAHAHWSLAQVYEQLGDTANVKNELSLYLQATQWHSDTYPWRIQLAKTKLNQMSHNTRPRPTRKIGSEN
jgi:tetratricopeptide (TPR) repeat protein